MTDHARTDGRMTLADRLRSEPRRFLAEAARNAAGITAIVALVLVGKTLAGTPLVSGPFVPLAVAAAFPVLFVACALCGHGLDNERLAIRDARDA